MKLLPIWTGEYLSVVVPSPSWPEPFDPHAQSVPSFFTATVCQSPAATEAKPLPT